MTFIPQRWRRHDHVMLTFDSGSTALLTAIQQLVNTTVTVDHKAYRGAATIVRTDPSGLTVELLDDLIPTAPTVDHLPYTGLSRLRVHNTRMRA